MAEWKTPTPEELELIRHLGIPDDHLIVTRPGDDTKAFVSLLDRVEIIATRQKAGWKITVFPSAY